MPDGKEVIQPTWRQRSTVATEGSLGRQLATQDRGATTAHSADMVSIEQYNLIKSKNNENNYYNVLLKIIILILKMIAIN